MAKVLPPCGTYKARRSNSIVVTAPESGSLLAFVPYVLCHEEWGAFSGTHMVVLGAKDGTLMKNNLAALKKIWPSFDVSNPFSLEDLAMPEEGNAEPEFELADCFHEPYQKDGEDKERVSFKAQWINPLGGSSNLPEKMDDASRKKTMTKWAGKLKAVAQTVNSEAKAPTKKESAAPAPKKEEKKAAAAPTRAAAGGPPSRGKSQTTATARSSSQAEVWAALVEKYPDAAEEGSEQERVSGLFYDAQDTVNPDANGDLTPQEWGQVADKLEV